MKKFLFLFFVSIFSFPLFSQTLASAEGEKTEEKIEPVNHEDESGIHFNVFLGLNGVQSHSEKEMKILGGVDMLLLLRKTYHYLTFDGVNNELSSTNGYKWNENLGSYVFLSYGLSKKHEEFELINSFHQKTVTVGLEYFFSLNKEDPLEMIFFTELGKEFPGGTFFSIGFIAEIKLK